MHFLETMLKSAIGLSGLFSEKLIHLQNPFQIIKVYTGYFIQNT